MLENFFDGEHYRRQTGRDFDDATALRHFLAEGDAAGLDPSPYFSTRWYKTRYAAWARRGAATALGDFLPRIARGEKRRPHPMIDPVCYRDSYPDLADMGGLDAFLHFMRHGDGEGRTPSERFDADFYRRCYLPLGQGHPFRHYVTIGAAIGHLARPHRRDLSASRDAMRHKMAGLSRPVVIVVHDAQLAGVPILALDLARGLRMRGLTPLFLLDRAGPMVARFRSLGPVFIAAEGWNVDGLATGMPNGAPILVTTAAAAGLARALVENGGRSLVLVHEMTDYLRDQGMMPDLRDLKANGAQIIASMPRMASALAPEIGSVDVLQPGIVLPKTPLAAFRLRQEQRQAGSRRPIFIGAGYADRRKGFDLFLSAAKRITQLQAQAGFVWLGEMDEWARCLADAARAEGLDLTLPGFAEDSLAWYRAADTCLLTSRQDPGPTTVIHAAAMGTPFVGYAADIGLIGLTDGIGTFLPPGDEEGFAEVALATAAGVTPATRRRLRRHVRAVTNFDRYVDGILSRLGVATDDVA